MITISHLTKMYGQYPAVIDVSAKVRQGEIVGFLGPNGAGKTTTMRVMTGFTPPTYGEVRIADYDIVAHSLEARRHIGYLPETVPLYLDMEVTDYLRFMGQIRGMDSRWIDRRLPQVIDIVRVGDYRHTLLAKLSKGFRQRVGIAQAIMHEPDVLILDEPTIGIDPIQVVETRGLIKELGGEHTLILSSHILPEVSMICKRVLVIHDGRIVADDAPANLSERLRRHDRIEMTVSGAPAVADIMRRLRALPMVIDVRQDEIAGAASASHDGLISLIVDARHDQGGAAAVAKTVVNNDWDLVNLHPIPMSLEEIFLELTTEEDLGVSA